MSLPILDVGRDIVDFFGDVRAEFFPSEPDPFVPGGTFTQPQEVPMALSGAACPPNVTLPDCITASQAALAASRGINVSQFHVAGTGPDGQLLLKKKRRRRRKRLTKSDQDAITFLVAALGKGQTTSLALSKIL